MKCILWSPFNITLPLKLPKNAYIFLNFQKITLFELEYPRYSNSFNMVSMGVMKISDWYFMRLTCSLASLKVAVILYGDHRMHFMQYLKSHCFYLHGGISTNIRPLCPLMWSCSAHRKPSLVNEVSFEAPSLALQF